MKKLIAIVAGEPKSINTEIIGKAWKKAKNKKNFFVIGSYALIKKQIKEIGLKIKILKINSIKEIRNKNNLNVLDVHLKFKSNYSTSVIDTKK